jgi:hypothetical protein
VNVRRTGALRLLAVRHLVEDQETFLANYSVVLAWRIYLVQSSDFVPDRTYYASEYVSTRLSTDVCWQSS